MEGKKLIIINNINQLGLIRLFLEDLSKEWSLGAELIFQLNLVIEEYITNLIMYGYKNKEEHEISLEIKKEEGQISIIILDDGITFNILKVPENNEIRKPLKERRIGGLGIHMIKTLTDKLEYESDGKINKLVIVKKIG